MSISVQNEFHPGRHEDYLGGSGGAVTSTPFLRHRFFLKIQKKSAKFRKNVLAIFFRKYFRKILGGTREPDFA